MDPSPLRPIPAPVSQAMTEILSVIGRLAPTDVTVTLIGETGTGKDVFAHLIHDLSPRARHPFIVFDCGAVPPNLMESELFGHERGAFTGAHAEHAGAFERAAGGTLFLDEIGELPLDLQPRLLRVLDNRLVRRVGGTRDRRVDVRIVAATNRDLGALVTARLFRQDLYFRLAAAIVNLPPLRERLSDLPYLVMRLLTDLDRSEIEVPRETLDVLRAHSWPGNVRELKNVLACAIAFVDAGALEPRHLRFTDPPTEQTLLESAAARRPRPAGHRAGGHQADADPVVRQPRSRRAGAGHRAVDAVREASQVRALSHVPRSRIAAMRAALSVGLGMIVVLLQGGAARADGFLCTLGPGASGYVPLTNQPASPLATREAKRLFALVCPKNCGQIGVFRNATAPNALTVTVGDHMSKIVYNAAFLESMVRSYGLGASLGILAHEVGHHVDTVVPPPPWMNRGWGTELRADGWAGCELARAGSKGPELKSALQALAMSPSPAHPAWSLRAEALQRGFSGCGGGPLAALDVKKVGGAPPGCTQDDECKAGRVCYDGRCQEKAARPTLCAKDIDCPGSEVCNPAGTCQLPQTPAGGASASGARVAAIDPDACRDRCGNDQTECSGRSDVTLHACKAALVADPLYKECGCPRWPAGRLDCYQFCKDTYDKAKRCEASHEAAGSACLAVAARCVSDCP